MKKNIAVIAGGYSSEYIVSIKSAEGICSFLDREKFNVYTVVITKDKWMVVFPETNTEEIPVDKNNFSFFADGRKILFDFAWITIHGTPGEDGLLQGYFDMLGIPYSCCGVLAAALTFNKYCCKQYLAGFGIKSAKAVLLKKNGGINTGKLTKELGLPLFVKPNDGGSSFGTTKVTAPDRLKAAITMAFEEGSEVIVESFMEGMEVTCGCYKTDKIFVFPVTEVVSKNEFFDYEAKYTGDKVEEITPARISKELSGKIQAMTAKIYDLVGAKGIIRADYIISVKGEIGLLEVNTTPGMTATSFIPQQIRAARLNIMDVLTDIIDHISSSCLQSHS
ncbi:MAG: D-alanine--D-alanine ligase [Dysgonamonadaceae bacterium]|jgi:D-alanine-D-alanine ligase|nr:D-alanine--D-alanine ligase [Dysgonamonadaceae bacterium]